jgi:hypothetical protein
VRGERRRPNAERDGGVEEPRAVDMERHAALVGDGGDPGRGGDADRLVAEWLWAFSIATRPSSGSCGSDGSRNAAATSSGSRVPSAGPGAAGRSPDDDRVAGRLVADDVALGAGDDLAAPAGRGP